MTRLPPGSAGYNPTTLKPPQPYREGKATMAWQDVFPLNVSRIDAEEEREQRLAAQARAGAEWALAALVARYQPPVTRYLTRLTGNPETSRALAERIFVQMEKRLRGPHGGQRLRLWLLRACTEAGLDTLRHPHRGQGAPRLDGPHMAGLLSERAGDAAADKLRAGLGALANLTGSTSRQVRQLIWSTDPEAPHREPKTVSARSRDGGRGARGARATRANGKSTSSARNTPPIVLEEDPAQQDPREALRYRMVRAVLAEIPYGDAQCLALHLIAGLNQAEVARALGITNSATRRRIVQGLQLFAQRYEAAAASLGLSLEALAPSAPLTTQPPAIEQTAASGYAPLAEASPDTADGTHVEEQPAIVYDTPPFMVTRRTTGAPAAPAIPMPEPVTIDAVAAPDLAVSDAANTLILEEHEIAPPAPNVEKPPVIVETTAVVDAIPIAELSLADTLIASAPDAMTADDAVTLRLAAVEIPERPPAPAQTETATTVIPEAEHPVEPEAEPVVVVAAASDALPEAPAMAPMGAMAPVAARIVPVLTPASEAPRLVRIVPVLTSEAAEPAVAETAEMAETAELSAMRRVPVLSQPIAASAPADRVPLTGEQAGDGTETNVPAETEAAANPFDAPHETVALAAESTEAEAAPVEAQS